MFKAVLVTFILGLALSQAFPCNETLFKAKKAQKEGLIGIFIPQCEIDGTFKAKQCYASTGECYCVSEEGTKITNATRAEISCGCFREKYAVDQKGLIGAYSPQCKLDGSYEERQCSGSTGSCWCVNELGKRVSDQRSGLKECGCVLESIKASAKGLLGAFKPKCDTDGTYKPLQFHAGYAWCVDADGKQINNKTRELKDCKCVLTSYIVQREQLLGAFRPKCQADGTFEEKQCWGSTGQCWCVDESGKRVNEASRGLRSCGCVLEGYKAALKGLLGSYRPKCAADGTYKPMQFSEGYAWCVDASGAQINNKTRGLKACECVLQSNTAEQEHLLGSFRPKCDVDGTFSPMQCREHSCWCARADGTKLQVKAKSLESCNCYRQVDKLLKSKGPTVSLPDCSQ